MAARQNYYADSDGESSTTTNTYVEKLSLAFTPDANSTYFILGSWQVAYPSTAASIISKMENSTATNVFAEIWIEPSDTDSVNGWYMPNFAVGVDTFGASPASQTYKIQWRGEGTGSAARIKNTRLIAIKKDSLDQYAEDTSRTTTTTTTYLDKLTLTFTPATTGDYLLIYYALLEELDGEPYAARFYDGTTAYGEVDYQTKDASDVTPWGGIVKKSLTGGVEYNFKIQYHGGDAVTPAVVAISGTRILALRLSTLDNAYYAEDMTSQTTTTTTYLDRATLTATPAASEHLTLASCIYRTSSTSVSTFVQVLADATSLIEWVWEVNTTAGTLGTRTAIMLKKRTESGASTTWKYQHRSETTAATSLIDDQAIAVLQLAAAAAGGGEAPNWPVMTPRHQFWGPRYS